MDNQQMQDQEKMHMQDQEQQMHMQEQMHLQEQMPNYDDNKNICKECDTQQTEFEYKSLYNLAPESNENKLINEFLILLGGGKNKQKMNPSVVEMKNEIDLKKSELKEEREYLYNQYRYRLYKHRRH